MAKKKSSEQQERLDIPYFEGVNSLVNHNIAKKQELESAENYRSEKIGLIEKRQGYTRLGNLITSTGNYGIFYFDTAATGSNTGFYRICTVGGTTSAYYLNTSAAWTILSGGGTSLSAKDFSFIEAENNLFLVNGSDTNRYISSDGTTVVTSSTSTGHLYNSPKAYHINHYKDRLYVGDYTVGSTRYKTGVMRSSQPLGIIGLIDGDHAAGVCTPGDEIKVTDVKYLYATDTIDVYRGGSKVADVTVNAKSEDTFTINAITFAGAFTSFNSSDEIWVDGTYTGTRTFRWADNPKSGENVKQYDTFKLSGAHNDALTMFTNVGDVMVIGNKNTFSVWNDANLYNYDLGIGCVSNRGFVKHLGTLFFMHYSGIYATVGERPELISAKIEKYITGATKSGIEAAALGKKGYSIFASIGTVTLYNPDGSTKKTLSNVVLEYNLRQKNWFVHTDIDASEFASYTTASAHDRLQFNATTGHVYEFLRGVDDNDSEIHGQITTNNITLPKNFENIVYPKKIIIETERGSGIKCFISLDNQPFYAIKGDAVKGATIMRVTQRPNETGEARCRKIRISLRDSSKRLSSISRMAIVYTTSVEEEIDSE